MRYDDCCSDAGRRFSRHRLHSVPRPLLALFVFRRRRRSARRLHFTLVSNVIPRFIYDMFGVFWSTATLCKHRALCLPEAILYEILDSELSHAGRLFASLLSCDFTKLMCTPSFVGVSTVDFDLRASCSIASRCSFWLHLELNFGLLQWALRSSLNVDSIFCCLRAPRSSFAFHV